MKVAHLSTSHSGGAGLAARRLNDALIESGVDSSFITYGPSRRHVKANGLVYRDRSRAQNLFSSGLTVLQSHLIQSGEKLATPMSLNPLDLSLMPESVSDIIHLHAFYNLIGVEKFLLQRQETPKVITLHDERFYTGGCHYAGNCDRFISGCKSCPQVRDFFSGLVETSYISARRGLREGANIVFICPSNWIKERAMMALPFIDESKFIQIVNPIPKPVKTYPAREKVSTQVVIGFISANLENPIKNIDLLLSSLDTAADKSPGAFKLVLIGRSKTIYRKRSYDIEQFEISDELKFESAMNEIDMLVVPSREDNLPNVIGEALIRGITVLGSQVGGIPELLSKFSMPTFEENNSTQLVQLLKNTIIQPRDVVSLKAQELFGYEQVASQVIRVYESLL